RSGGDANGPSGAPVISADGRLVAFTSYASNLVAGDTNHVADIFVRNLVTGNTRLVSKGMSGDPANGESGFAGFTHDTHEIVFQSRASNLVPDDTNDSTDIFVRDLQANTTTLVSVSATGGPANGENIEPGISASGRWVAFSSLATNLDAGPDTNQRYDVFLRDVVAGTTTRVTVGVDGESLGDSFDPTVSADGRLVAFASASKNLVSSPPPANFTQVFVRDVVAGTTTEVSVNDNNRAPDG